MSSECAWGLCEWCEDSECTCGCHDVPDVSRNDVGVMSSPKIESVFIVNRAITEEELLMIWAMAGSHDVTTTDNGDGTYSQIFTPKGQCEHE
jgi:hypothetical protein